MNWNIKIGPFTLWAYTEELEGCVRQHFEVDASHNCLWHWGGTFKEDTTP